MDPPAADVESDSQTHIVSGSGYSIQRADETARGGDVAWQHAPDHLLMYRQVAGVESVVDLSVERDDENQVIRGHHRPGDQISPRLFF